MPSVRNGLALVLACRSSRDRAHALLANLRYGLALAMHGKSRPFIETVRVEGLSLTLDWTAAEHVPIREVLLRHEYAPDDTWLPRASDMVVDVGANAGVFTVDAARRVGVGGRVISIEPNPVAVQRLRVNVAANGLTDRVSVIAAAVGDRPGTVTLVMEGQNTTTARVAGAEDSSGDIPLVRLDDLLREEAIGSVDLLKIDVEGAEMSVLRGGRETLRRTHRLVVEVNDDDACPEIERLLSEGAFTELHRRPSGADSGATLMFASRT